MKSEKSAESVVQTIRERAAALAPELSALRRHLHQPSLGLAALRPPYPFIQCPGQLLLSGVRCLLGKFGSLGWNREPNRTNRNRIGSVPAFKKNRSVHIL